MNSVPGTEVVKTPTPHKANIEGIFGVWCLLLVAFIAPYSCCLKCLTSRMEPIIVFRIWIEICLRAFVKRRSNWSNCFAKFPFAFALFIMRLHSSSYCAGAEHKH